jgi:hypothetical protein
LIISTVPAGAATWRTGNSLGLRFGKERSLSVLARILSRPGRRGRRLRRRPWNSTLTWEDDMPDNGGVGHGER